MGDKYSKSKSEVRLQSCQAIQVQPILPLMWWMGVDPWGRSAWENERRALDRNGDYRPRELDAWGKDRMKNMQQ